MIGKMDKNEFFREATIRICGNLEIEQALHSTLKFIRGFIPIDIMLLEYFDSGKKVMRTVAKATIESGQKIDLVTHISEKAQKDAAEKYDKKKLKHLYYKEPKNDLLAKELLDFHNISADSLLVLVLESGKERIGNVVMILKGNIKLNKQQIDYLTLLNEPFTVALANHKKHREVIRLKELLTDDNKYLHQQLRQISGDEIIGSN